MVNEGYNTYIGKQIKNYTILHKLGGGGFAHVYLAQQNFPHGHLVAIKLLDPNYLKSKVRQFFLHEAQFLIELEHPHILPILGHGESEGTPYIVVEYGPGGTLREHINNFPPVTLDEALTILRQVGEAVHVAHQHGIIHCDLKPENILFSENNEAMLADFGIAIRLGAKDEFYGPPRGTYAYMAPEQFDGIFTKEGEQYSLGCIAYELFTGSHPFGYIDPFNPHDREIMKNGHKNAEPLPLRELNADLPVHIEKATIKAVAKKPQERHASVDAFIQSLQLSNTHSSKSWIPTTNPLHTPHPDVSSFKKLRQPITSFPEDLLSPPRVLEAVCRTARVEKQYTRTFRNLQRGDLPSLTSSKKGDNGNLRNIDQPVLHPKVTADDICKDTRDVTRSKNKDPIKTFDLRLPSDLYNLLDLSLAGSGLTLSEGVGEEPNRPREWQYTVIKNNLGQHCALVYVPHQYLDKGEEKNENTIRRILSLFPGLTLIIFSNLSRILAPPIERILVGEEGEWKKIWSIEKIHILSQSHIDEVARMDKLERQKRWITEHWGLKEMFQGVKELLSIQQMNGNDIETLVQIVENIPNLTDQSVRGWRTLLQEAGLGGIANEIDLKGPARTIAWELVDFLKRRAHLPGKPDCEVLGMLITSILKNEKLSSNEQESIRQIIRKYQLVPLSHPL